MSSSMLLAKKPNTEKLKIVESELLGFVNDMRLRILKSELKEDNKKIMIETLTTLDEIIKDLFASEYYRAKSLGSV